LNTSFYKSDRVHWGIELVRVSNIPPWWLYFSRPWLRGIRTYKPLYPPKDLYWDYLNGKISDEQYRIRYHIKVLSKLNPEKVYQDLGQDTTILCFCKQGNFCHREVIAEWFYDHLGIEVPEL